MESAHSCKVLGFTVDSVKAEMKWERLTVGHFKLCTAISAWHSNVAGIYGAINQRDSCLITSQTEVEDKLMKTQRYLL